MKLTLSVLHKGVLALVLLSLGFASIGLPIRYLGTTFELFQQIYLRLFVALVVGLIFFHKDLDFSKLRRISAKEWLLLLFRATAGYLIAVSLYSQAVILTKYSSVSFLSVIPVGAFLGMLFFKERLTFNKGVFIAASFLGVVAIAVQDYSHLFSWGKGEFFAFLSTFFFTSTYVSRKWHSDLLNNKEIAVIIFAIASVLILATSLALGEGLPPNVSDWGIRIALALVVAGLLNVTNLYLINYGYQRIEAIQATNILTLESLFALGLGFIFFRELPTFKEVIGGLLIVGSVVGMNKEEEKLLKGGGGSA